MKVSCLRHGITALNVQGVFSGAGGEGLTREQRSELDSIDFDTTGFDVVYCSPAARCKETAECLGLPPHVEDSRLAERHFGIFDGHTPEECGRIYAVEFVAFQRLDAEFVIPGGESRAQHLERVMSWLREVCEVHHHVLAVTHGGTIDFLFRLGTGRVVHGGNQVFAGPNAALSVFDVSWPDVTVVTHGQVLVDSDSA